MRIHSLCTFALTFIASVGVQGFTPSSANVAQTSSRAAETWMVDQKGVYSSTELAMKDAVSSNDDDAMISRKKFMNIATVAAAAATATTLGLPFEASARGRATLEAAQDRYYPRLLAGGEFYANDLKKAIEKNDWNAIKVCTILLLRLTLDQKIRVNSLICTVLYVAFYPCCIAWLAPILLY